MPNSLLLMRWLESILGQAFSMTTGVCLEHGTGQSAGASGQVTWLETRAERQELAHPTGCSFHTSAASTSPLFVSSTSSLASVTLSVRKGPWSRMGGDWGSRGGAAVPRFFPWRLPQRVKMGYWVFRQCCSLPRSQVLPPLSGC